MAPQRRDPADADAGGDPVIVASVGKPFGVRGEVYLFADPDLDLAFEPGEDFDTTDGRTLVVADAHEHRGRLIVAFDGVADRAAAEALRGVVLTVPRDAIELDDDTLWVAVLKGREVVDADGHLVGVIETVRDGHAHDYLVIATPNGGAVTVPHVPEIVSLEQDVVVLTPPLGLLDPDEAW